MSFWPANSSTLSNAQVVISDWKEDHTTTDHTRASAGDHARQRCRPQRRPTNPTS